MLPQKTSTLGTCENFYRKIRGNMGLATVFWILLCVTLVKLFLSFQPVRQSVTQNSLLYPTKYSYYAFGGANFPIAFTILAFTDIDRLYHLVHTIYRPKNAYCIHLDKKLPAHVYEGLKRDADSGGNNIIIVPDELRLDVAWGKMSIVLAEITCMRLLINYTKPWLYWINLTGQEFPLRTDWELVEALKALNGTNGVDAMLKRRNLERFPPTSWLNFSFTWYKGSTHVFLKREFVEFLLKDQRALDILKSLQLHEDQASGLIVPDETLYATLNHNPLTIPAPGAFLGEHEETTAIPARYKVWSDSHLPCGSQFWSRAVCILGNKDIPRLKASPAFFANKFSPLVEPQAFFDLKSWLLYKMNYELTHRKLHPSFNKSFYASLEIAWNHI